MLAANVTTGANFEYKANPQILFFIDRWAKSVLLQPTIIA